MRTLIDIPDEDIKLLNQVAKKLSVSGRSWCGGLLQTLSRPIGRR